MSLLGRVSVDRFLERHWQRTPLLVREALPRLPALVSREEICALATTPGVEARLIVAPAAGAGWRVERAPLSTEAMTDLPREGWTVLVQEANRHVAELADLLEQFRFVPNWRLDDVMVSYAADGGGIGPHVDRYDVFLLQIAGSRRWRIGAEPLTDIRLQRGSGHPVLARFEPDREWVLEPGDLLYLPPGLPHEGVALGDCTTYSIGFRSPDPRELFGAFLRQLGPGAYERVRYRDPGLDRPARLGEIDVVARTRLRDGLLQILDPIAEFDRFLGMHLTRPLRGAVQPENTIRLDSAETLWQLLRMNGRLRRSAPAHFAWYTGEDEVVRLFVGGEEYPLGPGSETTAELICGRGSLDSRSLLPYLADESFVAVLLDLAIRGFLIPVPASAD